MLFLLDEVLHGTNSSDLAFDYTLRAGPVQKGNALELMRAIGLKV